MPFSLDPEPAEDETECARCGAHFHYGLSRCPNCGVNLYEPEEEPPAAASRKPRRKTDLFKRARERVLAFFRQIRKEPDPVEALFAPALEQAEAFNDLLERVDGDRARAEALIEAERRQKPHGSRLEWICAALEKMVGQ